MSNRRTLMAAAAIVLALVAGIGVYMYASGADERAQENASFVDAFVANSDIAKGTTGNEIIQAGLVSKEKVARSSRAAVDRSPTWTNSSARSPPGRSNAKQFITARRSCRRRTASAVRSRTRSSQDLVAVTVNVDADRGVANQIAPGDHVNIAAQGRSDRGRRGRVRRTSSRT